MKMNECLYDQYFLLSQEQIYFKTHEKEWEEITNNLTLLIEAHLRYRSSPFFNETIWQKEFNEHAQLLILLGTVLQKQTQFLSPFGQITIIPLIDEKGRHYDGFDYQIDRC
jgi:hypothetical protein